MDPEILKLLTGEFGNSDQGKALMDLLNSQEGFKNKQLDQAWNIAQLNESGANSRARTSAGASIRGAEISASASRANAKLAAETQRYGIDQGRLTDKERLGLDYAKTAADLHGPESFLEESNFLHGASGNPDVPLFMQALTSGLNLPGFQAPSGQPAGYTMNSVLGKLTGGQGTDYSGFVNSAKDLAARGFHTLRPGALESLLPTEVGALKDAVQLSSLNGNQLPAWSWENLLALNKRSGLGQGDPYAA